MGLIQALTRKKTYHASDSVHKRTAAVFVDFEQVADRSATV